MGKLSERIIGSPVGAKALMSLTGLGLIGFLLAHLSGNLLLFAGRDAFNAYALKLHELGPILWGLRLGLLAIFVVHVYLGIRLTGENKAARPVKYAFEQTVKASWASRNMLLTGLLLLIFICYHLAHYTFKLLDDRFLTLDQGDVYSMAVMGFSNPVTSFFYIAAMVMTGLHLRHGGSSLFQSLGVNHPNINCVLKCVGPALAALIAGGFILIPLGVLAGIIKL